MNKKVLITGTSSGIGLACVEQFVGAGFHVTATVRKLEDEKRLKKKFSSITVLLLDLKDEKSIDDIIGGHFEKIGGVDIVVNNAGFSCIGAVEEVSMDQWRAQMETNFFAVVNICRLAIPYMRKKRNGRIIQVSSGVGQSVMPIFAPYCTSKHALEAFSEALRFEVSQFGIDVSLVAPGPVKSNFDKNREIPAMSDVEASPYKDTIEHIQKSTAAVHERESKAEDVVKKIMYVATARRTRFRYSVGPLGFAATLAKFVPSPIMGWALKPKSSNKVLNFS